jgi:tetratricopeptide (TPR) repeat protein
VRHVERRSHATRSLQKRRLTNGTRAVSASALLLFGVVLVGCAEFAQMAPTDNKPALATPKQPKLEPPLSAESRPLYEQALTALESGRYPDAEKLLLTVISRDPQVAGPHANLGIVFARTNRAKQALDALQEAIRLNPDRAAYYNEIGMVLRREGKFSDARRYYEKALDADANYAYAHLNIAILYDLYMQEPEHALAHYQRYRELEPKEAATVTKWIADLQQRGRATDKSKGDRNG